MRTRKARLQDAQRIYELVAEYARVAILLPRSLEEICENIRNFTVAVHEKQVVGCGGLHFYEPDLAEIRSLAVAREAQGRGAGRRLVRALLKEAQHHGVARICLFTHIPHYFARLGFAEVPPLSLPEKAWKDCLKCPKASCCDETAMMYGGLPARPTVSTGSAAETGPRLGAYTALRVLPG